MQDEDVRCRLEIWLQALVKIICFIPWNMLVKFDVYAVVQPWPLELKGDRAMFISMLADGTFTLPQEAAATDGFTWQAWAIAAGCAGPGPHDLLTCLGR